MNDRFWQAMAFVMLVFFLVMTIAHAYQALEVERLTVENAALRARLSAYEAAVK